jgi:hypothetical protein
MVEVWSNVNGSTLLYRFFVSCGILISGMRSLNCVLIKTCLSCGSSKQEVVLLAQK